MSHAGTFLPLTPAVLHILLALSEEQRHGYAIAQNVEDSTDGSLRMGPGTLYGSIQRMLDSALIADAPRPPANVSKTDAKRRHYYKITPLGRQVLALELDRLEKVIAHAKRARLLPRRTEPA